MNTLDVLIAARAEVEKGWCQQPQDKDGNVCALFALGRAIGTPGNCTDPRINGPHVALMIALEETTGRSCPSVSDFNDDPATTQADVLAMFDRAINAEAAKVAPVTDTAHTFEVAA